MIVVGVDAGGTSTKALAWDTVTHTAVGLGRSGPGNPASAGAQIAASNVVAALTEATCGRIGEVESVALTMAGGSATGGHLVGLADEAAEAGLTCSIELHPDLLGAWFSGTSDDHGAVLIAGTGAVAATVVDGRIADLIDGSGWLLGDDGAGFWIGRRAVHDVLAAIDGRGPATALTDLVLARTPQTRPGALGGRLADRPGDPRRVAIIEHCYGLRPVELSAFAPLVVQSVGDPVADRILSDAADLLAATLSVALGRVRPDTPVVVAGSIATVDSVVRDRLAERLGDRLRLAQDGVVGASLLALRAAGLPADEGTRLALRKRLQGQP